MIVIRHRVNTIAALRATPPELGVEIDIRDRAGRLILQHDAHADGEDLEPYLREYQHAFLIANVKCEGIEGEVGELLERYLIRDYFFLDLSIPAAVKLNRRGERRLAVRWSELEPIELAAAFRGAAEWVWIDCFTAYPPLDDRVRETLRAFRTCLVAPELQGRTSTAPSQMREWLKTFAPAAVCTKDPDAWRAASEALEA